MNEINDSAVNKKALGPQNILFFDGTCGFCNYWVRFFVKRDHKKRMHYAPLQGETASEKLTEEECQSLSSAILWTVDGKKKKSSAALEALILLGGLWSLSRLLLLIPRFLRDPIYDFIAQRRYKISQSMSEACPLPTPEERQRFLP